MLWSENANSFLLGKLFEMQIILLENKRDQVVNLLSKQIA